VWDALNKMNMNALTMKREKKKLCCMSKERRRRRKKLARTFARYRSWEQLKKCAGCQPNLA
jgi:hypothetical protein